MAGFVFVSASTGSVVPASCQRNGCEVCGRRRALATAVAVDMAAPTRRYTLTGLDDHRRARPRLAKVRHAIRSEGIAWEDWSAVEVNPRGTGYHVHGYQRGDYVPQGLLSEIASSEGFGVVTDIRAHRPLGGSGAFYAVKAATTYGVKGATESLDVWLDLNGGRNGIWSRGFFGKPYNSALSEALGRSERVGHDPGPWVLKGTAEGIF